MLLDADFALGVKAIAVVFRILRKQFGGVGRVFNLRCFQHYAVGAPLAGELLYLTDLMLIVTEHDELHLNERIVAVQCLACRNHIADAVDGSLQRAAHAVLLVNLLRGSIDRNNKPVEAATHKVAAKFRGERLAVGGYCGEDSAAVSRSNHLAEIRIERRLALEEKLAADKPWRQGPQDIFEGFHVHQLTGTLQPAVA